MWKRWFNFVCGIPESHAHVVEPVVQRIKRLKESGAAKIALDINAVIALCVMIFLLGFYH